MRKSKNSILYTLISILIGVVISLTMIFFLDKFVMSERTNNELDENNASLENNNTGNDVEEDNNTNDDTDEKDNSYKGEVDNNNNNNNNNNDNDNSNDNSDFEEDENLGNDENISISPVSFFENVEKSNDENVIKDGFIKIVDFLFYDGTIHGYKFSELTSEAKLKIMKIALSLDKKIDEYFPGYKESISSGAKNAYNSVKAFVVELYLDTTSKICTNDPQLCKFAKEDFAYMKESFGITWDFIKNLANVGVDKLKEWYEIFRES